MSELRGELADLYPHVCFGFGIWQVHEIPHRDGHMRMMIELTRRKGRIFKGPHKVFNFFFSTIGNWFERHVCAPDNINTDLTEVRRLIFLVSPSQYLRLP